MYQFLKGLYLIGTDKTHGEKKKKTGALSVVGFLFFVCLFISSSLILGD
jgi:hypothetical protein